MLRTSSALPAIAALALISCSAVAQQADVPPQPAAMQAIQAARLAAHANYLASDELGGRLTGSPGQHAAAAYIEEHFRALGLEPLGDVEGGDDGPRSFLQRYGVERTFLADGAAVSVGDADLGDTFALLGARAGAVEVDGEAVWLGYGRTRGASRDVAEDADLTGKVAIVAVKGPRGSVGGELSVEQKFGMSFGVLGSLGRTARGLAKLGAAAVLFVQGEDKVGLSDVLNYVAVSPGKATVSPNFPGADNSMGMMSRLARGGGVPTLVLSTAASARALAALGVTQAQLQAFLADGEAAPEGRAGVACALRYQVREDEDARASNVCAVLRGSDPALRDEAVIYSAHMDHVGRRMDGDVFNGADDNASGSAGLLAIARAFAESEQPPRRSVIFLSVSGEELGLWGSQYYSDNATWPLDQLVANVNTDMIGRSGPESGEMEVTVTPSYRHAKFSTIVRDAAAFGDAMGVTFASGDKYYTRSDHFNFAKKGIPVVFFCNGEHEDYHQVSDHADKLDAKKMERIARLAFWTGWHVANADARPQNLGKQKGW
ncbi:MAG: M20/M25/M40 family metallo-hydrolase [Planctomycetota bacterium]